MFELFPDVPEGIEYTDNFISEDEEFFLLNNLDRQEWDSALKRRVQHYGYKYDYYSGDVREKTTPIPDWIPDPGIEYDQVIVNEYEPGQGIGFHRDAMTYKDVIASLSLGSGASMLFSKGDEIKEMFLLPRSLVVMRGIARYDWKHSIPARKTDPKYGYRRKRRVAITYRSVL